MKVFQRADEMEVSVNLKAVRCAYAFLQASIMAYCMIRLIQTGEFPFPVFLIGLGSGFVFWSVKVGETKKLTKTEEDPDDQQN